jgi:hypothetical protein
MYALYEPGLAISGLPPPQPAPGPTDQLERRAVEPTERGALTTEDRPNIMYSSTAAVLQLLESSAKGFAELMAVVRGEDGAPTDLKPGVDVGERVDVYA